MTEKFWHIGSLCLLSSQITRPTESVLVTKYMFQFSLNLCQTLCTLINIQQVNIRANFYVLLTAHLSIILVINQLNAQNLVL